MIIEYQKFLIYENIFIYFIKLLRLDIIKKKSLRR
jgi:hypothetical protein